jgi:hypothetical protein
MYYLWTSSSAIPRSFVMTISGISFGFCKIKKDIQNTVTCLNWTYLRSAFFKCLYGVVQLTHSKFTLPHKLKLKEKHIDCCSTCYSHNRVFNEHNSYPTMILKPFLFYSWVVLFTSIQKCYIRAFLSFWCYLLCRIVFPRCKIVK